MLVPDVVDGNRFTFIIEPDDSKKKHFFQVHFSQAWSGYFNWVTVGSVNCSALRGDEVDGYFTPTFTAPPCYALVECHDTPRWQRFVDLQPLLPLALAATQPNASAPLRLLPVVFSDEMLQNSPCSFPLVTGGFVSSTAAFVTRQTYFAAVLTPVASAAAPPAAPLPSDVLVAEAVVVLFNLTDTAMANVSLSTYLRRNDSFAPMALTHQTLAVLCTIRDVATFEMTYHNATSFLAGRFVQNCAVADRNHSSLLLQKLCVADEACVGYTSTLDDVGLCLLYQGADPADTFAGMERWVALKAPEAARSCATTVEAAGIVAVYVRQTLLGDEPVEVFAGDEFIGRCGERFPFSGGVYGHSSECGTWLPCVVRRIPRDTPLVVVVPPSMTAGRCDAAVGVLFVLDNSSTGSDVTRAPPPALPSELTDGQLQAAFPFRLDMGAALPARRVPAFLLVNTQRTVLTVKQTGFDCSRLPAGRRCTGPGVVVSILQPLLSRQQVAGSPAVLQSCGGSLPFLLNQSGMSDRCGTDKFCGEPFAPEGQQLQSTSSPLAGNSTMLFRWLSVDADLELLTLASSGCPQFAASLFAAPMPGANISGFLLRERPSRFRIFLAPTHKTSASVSLGASPTAAALGLVDPTTVAYAAEASEVSLLLGSAVRRTAYFVNWTRMTGTDEAGGAASAFLAANASLACVMDHVTTQTASCYFPVPRAANYLSLFVAQTHAKAVYRVEMLSLQQTVLQTSTCGGARGFGGRPPRDESCDVFLPCRVGFVPRHTAIVRFIAPIEAGGSLTCRAAVAAAVDFSVLTITNDTLPAHLCGFRCTANMACIARSQVCDGVVNCVDGEDEESCKAWRLVEEDHAVAGTLQPARVEAVGSFFECRGIAVRNSTFLAFAMDPQQQQCALFAASEGQQLLTNPDEFVIRRPGFTIFVKLDSLDAYGRCSSALLCSGNGDASGARVNNRTVCTCLCTTGFSGADCSTPLSLAANGPLAVYLASPNTSLGPLHVSGAMTTLAERPIAVSCTPFAKSPGANEQLLTFCTLSGAGAADAQPFFASALGLQALQRLVGQAVQRTEVVSPPLPQRLRCNSSGCGIGRPLAVASLRLQSAASTASGAYAVTLGLHTADDASPARRLFHQQRALAFQCGGNSSLTLTSLSPSGCVQTVCLLGGGDGGLQRVTSVSFAAVPPPGEKDPCYVPLQVDVTETLSLPPRDQPAIENVLTRDYAAVLGASAVMLLGGCASAVLSIWMMRKRLAGYAAWHDEQGKQSAAAMDTAQAFVSDGDAEKKGTERDLQDAEGDAPSEEKGSGDVDRSSWLVAATQRAVYLLLHARHLAIAAALLCAAAVALLVGWMLVALVFVTPVTRSSTVVVLGEVFRSTSCDASLLSPLPTLAFLIPADTALDCLPRYFAGGTAAPVYAAAECSAAGPGGPRLVRFRIGHSRAACERAEQMVEAGTCRPSPLATAGADGIAFVCVSLGAATHRMAAMEVLNGDIVAQPAFSRALDAPPVAPPALPAYILVKNRVEQLELLPSSSHAPSRYESTATAALLVGPLDMLRVIASAARPIDAAATNIAALPPQVLANGPRDMDFPAGFLYGGFGSPSQSVGAAAGPLAGRYHGMRLSEADMGRHAKASSFTSDGATVSMYLRVSARTRGFAFLLIDGQEAASGASPLADMLLSALGRQATAATIAALFRSYAPYQLYASLYVDGPAGALRYIAVQRPSGSPPQVHLEDLTWPGLPLFDGSWHHVALLLRSVSGHLKAQLVLDGLTSTRDVHWNKCMRRAPAAMQHFDAAEELPVESAVTMRVVNDAVLYTGYFNGGIGHLEFSSKVRSVGDVLSRSFEPVRSDSAQLGWTLVGIASAGLAVALIVFLLTLRTEGRRWWCARCAQQHARRQHVLQLYKQLWACRPADEERLPYDLLPVSCAQQLLGLPDGRLLVLLELLRHNFPNPDEILVRLLFQQATAAACAATNDLPSAAEWRRVMEPLRKHAALHPSAQSGVSEAFAVELQEAAPPTDAAALAGAAHQLRQSLRHAHRRSQHRQESRATSHRDATEGSKREDDDADDPVFENFVFHAGADEEEQQQQQQQQQQAEQQTVSTTTTCSDGPFAWFDGEEQPAEQLPNVPEGYSPDDGHLFDSSVAGRKRASAISPLATSMPPDSVYVKLQALQDNPGSCFSFSDSDIDGTVDEHAADVLDEDRPVMRVAMGQPAFDAFSLPPTSTTVSSGEEDFDDPEEQAYLDAAIAGVSLMAAAAPSDAAVADERRLSLERGLSRVGTMRRRRSRLASFRQPEEEPPPPVVEPEPEVPQPDVAAFVHFCRPTSLEYVPSAGEALLPIVLSLQVAAIVAVSVSTPAQVIDSPMFSLLLLVRGDVSALRQSPGLSTLWLQHVLFFVSASAFLALLVPRDFLSFICCLGQYIADVAKALGCLTLDDLADDGSVASFSCSDSSSPSPVPESTARYAVPSSLGSVFEHAGEEEGAASSGGQLPPSQEDAGPAERSSEQQEPSPLASAEWQAAEAQPPLTANAASSFVMMGVDVVSSSGASSVDEAGSADAALKEEDAWGTAGQVRYCPSTCLSHGATLVLHCQHSAWPACANPRRVVTCCFSRHGSDACKAADGVFFRCPMQDCPFAVCELHFVHSRWARAAACLRAWLPSVPAPSTERSSWQLCRTYFFRILAQVSVPVLLALLLVSWLPTLLSAVDVLTCGEQFQCHMQCWARHDLVFVAAAFLSVLVLLTAGLALPAAVLAVTAARMRALAKVSETLTPVHLATWWRSDAADLSGLYRHARLIVNLLRAPTVFCLLVIATVSVATIEADSAGQASFLLFLLSLLAAVVLRTTQSECQSFDVLCKLCAGQSLAYAAAAVLHVGLQRANGADVAWLLLVDLALFVAGASVLLLRLFFWAVVQREVDRHASQRLVARFDLLQCTVRCVARSRTRAVHVQVVLPRRLGAGTDACGTVLVHLSDPPTGAALHRLVRDCIARRHPKLFAKSSKGAAGELLLVFGPCTVAIAGCDFDIAVHDDYDVAWLCEALNASAHEEARLTVVPFGTVECRDSGADVTRRLHEAVEQEPRADRVERSVDCTGVEPDSE